MNDHGAAGPVDLVAAGGAGCGRVTVRPSGPPLRPARLRCARGSVGVVSPTRSDHGGDRPRETAMETELSAGNRRRIGLDVHREFGQVAIWQGGPVCQAGRFATTPEGGAGSPRAWDRVMGGVGGHREDGRRLASHPGRPNAGGRQHGSRRVGPRPPPPNATPVLAGVKVVLAALRALHRDPGCGPATPGCAGDEQKMSPQQPATKEGVDDFIRDQMTMARRRTALEPDVLGPADNASGRPTTRSAAIWARHRDR